MRIVRDSLIYLAGELIAKSLPFLLLPYLTRKLGIAHFGDLSFYQTICALLVLVFGLSQDGSVARYFYVYGKRNLSQIMQAGYAYTMVCTLLALGFAWFKQSILLASVILAAAAQSILSVQLAWRQCQKRAISYTSIQISSAILTTFLTIILLQISEQADIVWRFVALFVGNLLVSVLAYLWAYPKQKRSGSLKRFLLSLRYIFALGIPLLLHQASGFTKGQLDRIIIYQNYSNDQLGIYAAGFQLASVLSVLLMAINKATVPYYYQAIKQGKLNAQKIRCIAGYSLLITPIFAAITALLPENVFIWLLGSQYDGVSHYVILFLLEFGLTIPYYILVNFLFYHGRNKRIALISLLSTVIYLVVLIISNQIDIRYVPSAMIAGNLSILPFLWRHIHD